MGIAKQLEWFLEEVGVEYEVLPHPHSSYSAQTARRSRIPLQLLAKPVLLEDEYGYVMAVVSAARQVDIDRLGAQLHRHLDLATEAEVGDLFRDCEPGAMPALGTPYQIPTVYDDSLAALPEIYFEAGDHDIVVHMSGDAFLELLSESLHGRFSRAAKAPDARRSSGNAARGPEVSDGNDRRRQPLGVDSTRPDRLQRPLRASSEAVRPARRPKKDPSPRERPLL